MMAADSLRIIVLSGVSLRLLSPCRGVCSARADLAYSARHFAQPSHVQASCLERARPAAIGAFAGALAAGAAALPGRRCRERKWETKAEGKTKGGGTCRSATPVCTWGWRGTERLRRRAAWGARPASIRACPRASHDGTRLSFSWRQR